MNAGQRQVIAEKVASTVRVLELLGFHDYVVTPPRHKREKGNSSPRVVRVNIGEKLPLRIYNGTRGSTWANLPDGTPIPGIVVLEDLYRYLENLRDGNGKARKSGRRPARRKR